MEKKVYTKVQNLLAGSELSKTAQTKIMRALRNDQILLRMQLNARSKVSLREADNLVFLSIGARDLDFDNKGEWIGSGTSLWLAKWKPGETPCIQKKVTLRKTKKKPRKSSRK